MADTPLLALRHHPQGVPWPTDSWSHASPDPRVDSAELDRLLDYALSDTDPEDLEHTHGVVIVQGGMIVAERYSQDGGPDRPCHSMSMAKSVTCSLVGILVRLGKLDISWPMGVKEWSADDKRSRITIDQMLRMVDGLRFREAEYLAGEPARLYPREESDGFAMIYGEGKADVAAFASTMPYVAEPESIWNYNSGGSNLLARLVGETIGGGEAETLEFMHRELFEPLGMSSAKPGFDDAGNFIGSMSLYCTPRDFARFGYLHLRDGVWDERQILPNGWVDYCRSPTPQSGGYYGAHFWVAPGDLGTFYARGIGGQQIMISPKLDLVLVRLGRTAPEKMGAVGRYCDSLIDLFRPIA